jgi:hypothetical protein
VDTLRLEKICNAVQIIAAINFFSFAIIAIIIGGDALNGYTQGGRYFIGQNGYEVSYPVFLYSKIHAYSVFLTTSALLVSNILLWKIKSKTKRKGVEDAFT